METSMPFLVDVNTNKYKLQVGDVVCASGKPMFDPAAVELDDRGLPRRFRILPYGAGSLTWHTHRLAFVFTPEHAALMVANAERKGEAIPIDCEHSAYALAEQEGVEEAEIVSRPLIGERLACGFVTLKAEEDGLWAEVASWAPRAAMLLQEKLYRYFSPVIRGCQDRSLRITSLALTNEPATDFQTALVASATGGGDGGDGGDTDPTAAEASPDLPLWLRDLADFLGITPANADPTADLNASPAWPAAWSALRAEVETLRATAQADRDRHLACDAFLATVRVPLALSADADLDAAAGGIAALHERTRQHDGLLEAMREELDKLYAVQEDTARQTLLASGLAKGQLTPHLVETWAGRQDLDALRAWLATAPVMASSTRLDLATLPTDAEPLWSGPLETVARTCGVSLAAVRATGTPPSAT